MGMGKGRNVTIARDAPAAGTGLSHNRSQWDLGSGQKGSTHFFYLFIFTFWAKLHF